MKKHISLITALLPLIASAQLVMTNNYYVVMNGGTLANPTSLVITNPLPAGITNSGGAGIVSENEFNQVDWNIGTSTGSYVVPFGYGTDLIPVTCNITTAGVGAGAIRFATYHGSTWDNTLYKPSDVTTMSDFQAPDYSNNAVDRFWILDAQGYGTKPTPNITMTYVRSGASSEIAVPNYIVEADLIAQRFNSTVSSDVWNDWFGATGLDVTAGNTGTVTSGAVPPADFYRSWALFNDSATLAGTGVRDLTVSSAVVTFPNPTNGSFTVSGLTQGQVVELYNYLGQRLTSTLVDNTTMHFDIGTKANGIYLIRIDNTDGSLATEKKIVKEE